MTDYRDDLLCEFLNCGYSDLSLLKDVNYAYCDVIKETKEIFGNIDLNSIMQTVFEMGLRDIETAINDRIAQIEAIENKRELDTDEQEELDCLRQLNPIEDTEQYHNYLDTSIWWKDENKCGYEKYLEEALDKFYDMTGFEIE